MITDVMASNTEMVLPTESSQLKLTEIVANLLQTNDFSLKIEEGSKKGDNYIGIVYRCIATKNHKHSARDNQELETVSIFVKMAPQNEARRQHFFTKPCFIRETLFYEELYPLFREFQKAKGVTNGFTEVPLYFASITTDKEEAIFLEDLKCGGFEMLERRKTALITFEHVKKIMLVLGKFHAVSYALKAQDFEKLKPFTEVEDIFVRRKNDTGMITFTENAVHKAIDTLDVNSVRDQPIIERMKEVFKRSFFELFEDCVSCDDYSVMCHGDCWNNNILFKNKDEQPDEIKLLDFQMLRYASPATDIWYFFFVCTTKKFREMYFESLIGIYYDSLSQLLKRLGSDPEKIFPFAVLQEHIKKYAKFGMLMAILLLPLFTAQSSDTPDLEELAEKLQLQESTKELHNELTKSDNVYSHRMAEVIRDMFEKGYL